MAMILPAALLDAALAHARASPDQEVCGLLWGTRHRIDRLEPTDNVAADTTAWFEVDPRRLIAALRAERTSADRLIGHYHSHPNGSAEPSPRDAAAAEPGRYWLIIGDGIARMWLAKAGTFAEIDLIVA